MEICKLKNYLETAYKEKPKTDYPKKLVKLIMHKFDVSGSVLDVGCGRGDHVKGFHECGCKEVVACDIYDKQKKVLESQGIKFKKVDFTKGRLPFKSESFDLVFCKSVIEHLERDHIFKLFKEMNRVLKKTGKLVVITPHWNYMHKYFYDDISHITPFNELSLKQIIQLTGFNSVKSYLLIQLPFLWHLPQFIQRLIIVFFSLFPDSLRSKSKLIRYSKERMLLGVIQK